MHDKNTRKILSGVTWLGLSAIFLKLIGLVYKIPISYLLGDEGMGYFNSAYTVYTFFYIIGSAGIPKAISILCAKTTPAEAKTIFLLIYRIYLFIGAILTIILLITADFVASSIGSQNSSYTIFAIAPSIFFVCASGVLRGYLSGKTKFKPVAISEIISALCKLILGLILALYAIKKGFSLPIICAFSILGITLGSFFGFIYLYSSYKEESKEISREMIAKKNIICDVLRIGMPITFAVTISGLVNVIDLTLLMNRLKASGYSESICTIMYGNYTTLAVPMFSFGTNLINTVSLSSLPIVTSNFIQHKAKEYEEAITSSLRIVLFISIPCFLAFLLFPVEILSAIFEESSARLGYVFLFFLSPGIIFYSLLAFTNTVLEGSGEIRLAVTSLSIGAIIKCIMSFTLIGIEEIGALGAPISTTISYGVSFALSLFFYKKYITKYNRNKLEIVRKSLVPFFCSVTSVIIAIIVKKTLLKNYNIRICSLITLAVFGIFYLFFILIVTILARKKKDFLAKCTI